MPHSSPRSWQLPLVFGKPKVLRASVSNLPFCMLLTMSASDWLRNYMTGFPSILRARQRIGLYSQTGDLVLSIADNGVGKPRKTAAGMGFRNMQDRVKAIGGLLTFESGGAGTTVKCSVPLAKAS